VKKLPFKKTILWLVLLIFLPVFALLGCNDTKGLVPAGVAVTDLFGLEIIPDENRTTISLTGVKTVQLMLRGTYRDGSQEMLETTLAEWLPKEGDAGVISIRGLFTGQKVGTIKIEAQIGLLKAEVVLTVTK
jgi:hypothetical protein